MRKKTPWQRWYHRVRSLTIKLFGGKCFDCGKKLGRANAQFAHLKPNGISGRGRGSFKRIKDVLEHPYNYALVCNGCHHEHDKKVENK